MKEKNILYTILSVLALIVVIIGIIFAYYAWSNEEKNNLKIENTLIN